jgi:hypothetical protein
MSGTGTAELESHSDLRRAATANETERASAKLADPVMTRSLSGTDRTREPYRT